MENPVPEQESGGSVEVQKSLIYNSEPLYARDQTFYVALFEDPECTVMVSDIQPLHFVNANSTTATFENLEVGTTYYVGEVDADGNFIDMVGTVEDGTPFFVNFSEGNKAVVTEANGVTRVEFDNEFQEIPDGYFLNGRLILTKKLLNADGSAQNSREVFYAGVFDDADFTQLSERVDRNVVPLNLNGGSEASDEVRVAQYEAGDEIVLYVTEVYADGTPVDDSFNYAVTIENGEPVFNEENIVQEVIITNQPAKEKVTPTPPRPGGSHDAVSDSHGRKDSSYTDRR